MIMLMIIGENYPASDHVMSERLDLIHMAAKVFAVARDTWHHRDDGSTVLEQPKHRVEK
ncbi:hypothetical protein ACFO4N_06370 [Camelliibacillus cellulosilyticus]|uniref:Uncharacterized protein n=2 Tax=Camelliibacillus cellulosilyticus TaxID=2174486 RepID=A0ABV9GP00_9BACL